jgi:hypothetical protein
MSSRGSGTLAREVTHADITIGGSRRGFAVFAKDIAGAIFPSTSPLASLMASFAAIVTGYFARPSGGIILSQRGARLGGRRVFLLSLFVMSAATLGMVLVPSFTQWGIAASALVVILAPDFRDSASAVKFQACWRQLGSADVAGFRPGAAPRLALRLGAGRAWRRVEFPGAALDGGVARACEPWRRGNRSASCCGRTPPTVRRSTLLGSGDERSHLRILLADVNLRVEMRE